jgi:toxin ParE1/3/4
MAGTDGPHPLAVLFTPRANAELLAAVRWWRSHRPEAPRLVDEELEHALRRIAVYPRSGALVRGRDVRRVVLRRTEYLLFYRVRPRLGRIEVISLSHARRE